MERQADRGEACIVLGWTLFFLLYIAGSQLTVVNWGSQQLARNSWTCLASQPRCVANFCHLLTWMQCLWLGFSPPVDSSETQSQLQCASQLTLNQVALVKRSKETNQLLLCRTLAHFCSCGCYIEQFQRHLFCVFLVLFLQQMLTDT